MRGVRARAQDAAEERVLDALLPAPRAVGFQETVAQEESATRQKFRKRLREGELNEREIEIEVSATAPQMEILAPPGMEELTSQIQGMFQNLAGGRRRTRKMRIAEAMQVLTDEEAAKLVSDEDLKGRALANVESNGIVFSTRSTRSRAVPKWPARTSRARACSATCCRSSKERPSRPATGWSRPTTSSSSPRARSTWRGLRT
jgi:ATP-dependent HslUV protease ATP-binding subunit HslU